MAGDSAAELPPGGLPLFAEAMAGASPELSAIESTLPMSAGVAEVGTAASDVMEASITGSVDDQDGVSSGWITPGSGIGNGSLAGGFRRITAAGSMPPFVTGRASIDESGTVSVMSTSTSETLNWGWLPSRFTVMVACKMVSSKT